MKINDHKRRERDRQIYHRMRWSGLTHKAIMDGTVKYHREKFFDHVADMVPLKKYVWRKLFLDVMVWTPLAIWILPFVFKFRKSKGWLQINAFIVIFEVIIILMLIF